MRVTSASIVMYIDENYLQILLSGLLCHREVQQREVPPQFQHDPVCLLESVLYDCPIHKITINENVGCLA